MLRSWRPYFIIFSLGFLLYSQSLFFDLTYLDDNALILDNAPRIQEEGVAGIFLNDAFFSDTHIYYRPLLNLSIWLDLQVGSSIPFVFHFSNIIIHLIAAGLIFAVFKKMQYSPPLSFFMAILFLVHPALTQAVAWVPGRNDSLLTLFILLGFLFLLNFNEKRTLKYYLLHLFLFFLALFTKETAIFAPLVFASYWFFVRREKAFSTDSSLLYLGWGAMIFIYFLVRNLALETSPSLGIAELLISLKDNLSAFVISSGKILFPVNLKVLPIVADSTLWYGWLTIIIVALLMVFSKKKNWRYFIFGLIWFLIFLLPTLLLHNPKWGVDFHLEHRIYLPLIGFLFLIIELIRLREINWNKKRTITLAALIIIILMVLTIFHGCHFQDRLIFWQTAADNSPHSPLALRNLGVMYYLADNLELAEKYYRQALVLNDQEVMVHNNLGIIYLKQGNYGAAEKEFKKELAINPQYDKALFNLGDLYYRQNRLSESQRFFQETLRVNPYYYEARERLLILENQLR